MTVLNDAQTALRNHLVGKVQADPLAAHVPAAPVAWAGYVWPATDWISPPDDDGSFCATRSVGLVLDLVAGTTDLAVSQTWLNDRVDEVWDAGPVAVGDDETMPERVLRPILVRLEGSGVELLVARVEFTRFTLED